MLLQHCSVTAVQLYLVAKIFKRQTYRLQGPQRLQNAFNQSTQFSGESIAGVESTTTTHILQCRIRRHGHWLSQKPTHGS